MRKNQLVDIVSALVSAACAVLCTLLAGCKFAVGEMSCKNVNWSVTIPNGDNNDETYL